MYYVIQIQEKGTWHDFGGTCDSYEAAAIAESLEVQGHTVQIVEDDAEME
jgi:hypothetical protein